MPVDLANDETRARLEAYIAGAAGASSATITHHTLLEGGAIQQNIALDVTLSGTPSSTGEGGGGGDGALTPRGTEGWTAYPTDRLDPLELVLRTSGEGRLPESRSREEEFTISRVAFEAGVTTPEPLWYCNDLEVVGQPFSLVRRIEGVAAAHRVIRDEKLGGPRPELLNRLGRELATLHTLRPPRADLAFLAVPNTSPPLAEVEEYRAYLDAHARPRPALEWALRWLERNAPASDEFVLRHGDFRTGNYMVDEHGLTGLLDWEFATWADPMSDIGWFTARCWRGGRIDLQAGGIGDLNDFLGGYEEISDRTIDRALVPYWELMAHVRWALIAIHQEEREAKEGRVALELALTGRIVNDLEFEAVRMVRAFEEASR
jgi:aminoglycoside phosphotransferase (APT) family kinase protein